MPYRHVELCPGEYYYLYNRGVNRGLIFFCVENWSFFLRQLRRYLTPAQVDIIAYCLMPNHYHLLIYLKAGNLGQDMMQPFSVSYVKAVNKQRGRSGPLFQGSYQARRVDGDGYLQQLSRYIHMNPVWAGLVALPQEWIFSSYREYIGQRSGSLRTPSAVLQQFPSPAAYQAFVDAYREEDARAIGHLLFDER